MADGKPFQYRVGFGGFPRWRGVNKQGPASSLQPNELRDAINVRYSGGEIVSRGGQSKLSSSTVTGCLFGIYDNPQQAYGVKIYVYGQDTGTGNNGVLLYSAENTPAIQTVTVANGAFYNPGFVSYNSLLHFIYGDALYRLDPIQLLPGQDASDLAGLARGVKLVSTPSAIAITTLAVMRPTLDADESIFIGTESGGHVYRWDGTSIIQDTTGALGSSPQVLTTFHEDLFVFGNHYANRRNAGAYTSITMPGGLTSFRPYDVATYKDKLYVAGYDRVGGANFQSKILVWDGSSLTVANSPTSIGTVGESHEGVRSLAVFGGYLFYGWRDPSSGSGLSMLGRFDGTTWVDAHKDLNAQFASNQTISLLSTPYALFAIVLNATGSTSPLVESPGSATSGTWINRGDLSGAAGASSLFQA